jgi:serine/threonine protein kinase
MNCDEYEETSIISSETDFPRNCGFCKHRFESRQERIDHIGEHFKQGKCMLDWNDNRGEESQDDDDANDDDDRPSDDGSDNSRPSHKPPHQDPRGGSDTKYSGGSGGGGGYTDDGSSGGSQGGYFQFQLSQLQEGGLGSQLYWANQHIKPTGESQQTQQQSRAASEPLPQQSSDLSSSSWQCSKHGEPDATKADDRDTLAGDAIAKALTTQHNIEASFVDEEVLPDSRHDRNAKPNQLAVLSSSTHDSSIVLSGRKATFSSVRFLGAGGFGMVDEVVHTETGVHLGRKTLKKRGPAAMKELLEEVNILKKLRHPHIIRFLGAYSRDDKVSILVSPVADTTLALWLDRATLQKPAGLAETITAMFGCLASSLRYLHEQQPVVVHMDIKPQNILVVEGDGQFPHVVLCDFGNSTTHANGQAQPLTRRYAAPEVFEGATRKQAADIWSLGCVFAEMASATYSQGKHDDWLSLRKDFSGRTSKCYWQDASGLQTRLTKLLDGVATPVESTVVHTLKSMLSPLPADRPSAASLTLIFTPAPCCEGKVYHAHDSVDASSGDCLQLPLSGKQAASVQSADTPLLLDQGLPLEPHRIRDCQWIRKQGDGIGDSMEAAQTTLQVGNASALLFADNHDEVLELSRQGIQPRPISGESSSRAPHHKYSISTCNADEASTGTHISEIGLMEENRKEGSRNGNTLGIDIGASVDDTCVAAMNEDLGDHVREE